MTTWPRTKALLFLCALFPLTGCLLEDSVTITNDGRVSFESIVTEPDEQKKIEFPALEKAVSNLVGELRKHKWKVQESWTSKERPYRLKVMGSGKLTEVTGLTTCYTLVKASDTAYQVTFLPWPDGNVRVVFATAPGSAAVSDAAGKPVREIEGVSASEIFTIHTDVTRAPSTEKDGKGTPPQERPAPKPPTKKH